MPSEICSFSLGMDLEILSQNRKRKMRRGTNYIRISKSGNRFPCRDPRNRKMNCLPQRRLLFEILLNVLPCGREAQGIRRADVKCENKKEIFLASSIHINNYI
jgi:hypothetical protein